MFIHNLLTPPPKDEYADPLNVDTQPNKVKIAHKYVELNTEPNFEVLDLKEQVEKIVGFIKKSNQME